MGPALREARYQALTHYTNEAARDLHSIAVYTRKAHGALQRDRYMAMLREVCEELLPERHERMARPFEPRPGILRYRADHHIVYFQLVPDGIEIVRILHQSMDQEQHF